jgi:anti-sigma B factor antagonist
MKLHYTRHGDLGVVLVEADRVDASVAIRFKDEFRTLVGESGPNIVLDMSQVTFLDSSGLGAVVAAKKLLGQDRELGLAGLQPAVDKVMTLTRMNTVFAIHETVQTAVAAG